MVARHALVEPQQANSPLQLGVRNILVGIRFEAIRKIFSVHFFERFLLICRLTVNAL